MTGFSAWRTSMWRHPPSNHQPNPTMGNSDRKTAAIRKLLDEADCPRTPCSLVVGCSEDVEEFRARKPHRRFMAWKGRDVWHQDISVQIRLEDDGRVFLSTQEGHVSTLRIATITLEKLHATIRGIIAENARAQAVPCENQPTNPDK